MTDVCSEKPKLSDRLQTQTSVESDPYIDIRTSDSDGKCDRTEESQILDQSEPDFHLLEDIPPIPDLSDATKRVLLTTPPPKDGIQFDQPNR